jgi:hypothetical protein
VIKCVNTFDFSKAFKSIKKLIHFNASVSVIKFINSYNSNRRKIVCFEGLRHWHQSQNMDN